MSEQHRRGHWARRFVATAAALALGVGSLGAVPADPSGGGTEVRIVRDGFGVPHVLAPDRESASYGAGYALAEDRLWQMHVLRHLGQGSLAEILGPVVIDLDRATRLYTYTPAERAARYETYPVQLRRDLEAYVDGVNARIDEVNRDPSLIPLEFAEYGIGPVPAWTVDDSLGIQDALVLSLGPRGGDELAQAALLDRLVDELGTDDGLAAFDDLVRTDDPDATVTIPAEFDWEGAPLRADEEAVNARRALTPDARLSLTDEEAAGGLASLLGVLTSSRNQPPGAREPALGTLAQLELIPDPQRAVEVVAPILEGLELLQQRLRFGSNAQIVGGSLSETDNTLQTGGPQVGFWVPQIVAEFGIHTDDGDISAVGMTFAGSGPVVLIGRGNGYAWTTTTGSSDIIDWYVEQLHPEDDHLYAYEGAWERMDCREEVHRLRGVPFETQEICRTRRGPVIGVDHDNRVAYSQRYSWFDREGQTVEAFAGMQESAGVDDFATSALTVSSNHNLFYSDDLGDHGFWHGANHPVRPAGLDRRLPADGSGGADWLGLRPVREIPRAVNLDRDWITNWNNQPAAGWDRNRAWPARDKSSSLERAFLESDTPDPDGGLVNASADGSWDFDDLNANLRYGGVVHHAHGWYAEVFPAGSDMASDLGRAAAEELRTWDGFLVDRTGDGHYDSGGPAILDRWLRNLRDDTFRPHLGADVAWARSGAEVWHLFSPDSTAEHRFDWLAGRDQDALLVGALERAATELAEQFGSDDPATWRDPIRLERYERLNADIAGNLVRSELCTLGDDTPLGCPEPFAPTRDSGMPGDIPEHLAMDRGSYNHIVSFLDPSPRATAEGGDVRGNRDGDVRRPGPSRRPDRPVRPGPADGGEGPSLGHARVRSGSVTPPGQSGFTDLAGREDPHFSDQLELFVTWRYKPMPLTRAEIATHAASEVTLTR
jgi:penicillin G amidase